MEIALKETNKLVVRGNQLMVISHTLLRALSSVKWFFTLTEIDRFKAGINTSGEGRNGFSHRDI